MTWVEPAVYFIGMTKLDRREIRRYLIDIGVPDWDSDAVSDGEFLVEVMGRLCYASFGTTLNPNITKVREGNALYIDNLLKSEHGSVFEHVMLNFIFSNVSRVFTHELVRHRAGTAISQESLRYVRLDGIDMYLPGVFVNNPEVRAILSEYVESSEQLQRRLAELYALDDPSADFHLKKQVTSAMRRFAPEVSTEIGWSSNIRNLRHVITVRTAAGAEEEARRVIGMLAEKVFVRFPAFFADFSKEEVSGSPYPAYVPKYKKV